MKKYLPFPVTVLVFKTANKNKGSVYEIGILSINKGEELVDRVIRVNPKTKTFSLNEYNQDGVNAAELKNEPTFGEIYPEIVEYISNKTLAMHYAKFHEQALLTALKRYKIEPPQYKIIDIYELAPYMNLEFEEENFKFPTIARACGINQTKWTTASKVHAIYEIVCQFYNKKPSLFKKYISKGKAVSLSKATVSNELKQPKNIEASSEEPPKKEDEALLEVAKIQGEGSLWGCLVFIIMVIAVIVLLVNSCGYDSDFQKNLRKENEQQEQLIPPVKEEENKRELPRGHGWSDEGRKCPIYYDTIGVIVEGVTKSEKVPVYLDFYSKDVIGYVQVGTEVSVKSQNLQHRGYGQYIGRLLVESNDTKQQFYIGVYNYVPTRFKD